MTIKIKKLKESKAHQVRIIELISNEDMYHKVEKITTSPTLPDEPAAKRWLARWLTTN